MVKSKKELFLLFLIVINGMFLIYSRCGVEFESNYNNNIEYKDITDIELIHKASSYSSSLNGVGGKLNLTLGQSISKQSASVFKILNFSDSDNSSFNIDCPNDKAFNLTQTKINISNIKTEDNYMKIEEVALFSDDITPTRPSVISFTTEHNAKIKNISVYLWELGGSNKGTAKIVLYNATWGGSYHIPGGTDDEDYILEIGQKNFTEGTFGWLDLTKDLSIDLDNSKTVNNTWFIGVYENNTFGGDSDLYYNKDTGHPQANGNQSTCLEWNGVSWTTVLDVGDTVDFDLKIGLTLSSNNPLPSDINMKINNTSIQDISLGSGYWENIIQFSSLPNQLEYNISADWWNVSCDITSIQVNYSRKDLAADSEFTISSKANQINWKVSPSEDLDVFDPGFTQYIINFTIPSTWNNFNVWNGSYNITDHATLRSLGNGYAEVEVQDAGNGTSWFLNATSDNLIIDINAMVSNLEDIASANYSDIICFNTKFINSIFQNDGVINLSIYSPSPNNTLNYTSVNSTFSTGTEFTLGTWNTKNFVEEYGTFRIQVHWHNDTAAGFWEENINILGVTELEEVQASSTFHADELFDISVYFNDTGKNLPVLGASITYKIGNGSWRTTNITDLQNGSYNITIDGSDSDFTTYGANIILVKASKHNYNDQSIQVNIVLLESENLSNGDGNPLALILGVSSIGIIGGVTLIMYVKFKKKNLLIKQGKK